MDPRLVGSCATLISIDVVKRIKPDATDRYIVRVGRITTGIVMILAMLWSTQGDQFGTIFEAINKIPMAFAPAVTTIFVLGVLWKRGTRQAAMATLYIGSIVGTLYFIVDLPSMGRLFLPPDQLTGFGGLISDSSKGLGIPFMLVGPIIAALCIVIYVVISYLTEPMDRLEVEKVCWDSPLAFLRGPITALSDPRIVSGSLVTIVGILYFLLR
jgi:solute:Na+ symporter, SSS family